MFKKFIVSTIFISCLLSAVANKYDDEEKIKRYLENAQQQEENEREAARIRYDAKLNQTSRNNDSTGGIIVVLLFIGVGVAGLVFFVNSK